MRLSVLGGLGLTRNGAPVAMPPSKKTRALLGYLALTGRTHRRERLCDLLWEDTEDPRAALRWSLSKIRALVDEPERPRIVADRAGVALEAGSLDVDLVAVRQALAPGVEKLDTAALEELLGRFDGELLEGLDLQDSLDYQAWLVAEREGARRLRVSMLRELAGRAADRPEVALPHARRLVEIDPLDEGARAALIRCLGRTGRREEAEQHHDAALKVMAELGRPVAPEITEAWRALRREPSPAPPPPSAPTPVASVASGPALREPSDLVGRAGEWAELRALLDAVREEGGGRVALILGEPGIGKSRLLAELASAAREAGGTLLEGRFYEAESARPYGAWIDAGAFEPSEAGESRERLFAAVVERIEALAADAPPVVVVLDDVQWCDDSSAALLHHVARVCRERPVALLLGAREGELPDNEAVGRVLRGLRREVGVTEVVLEPLAAADIAALVRAAGAEAVDAARLEESGGNPLFALELARAGARRAGELPGSLAELVRERVERLPAPAVEVLRWGAVLGRSFGLRCLLELTPVDAGGLAELLELLERHALIRALEHPRDPRGGYAFTHDVVQRVVYAELSAPRRGLMHARVATALEETRDGDESLAAEIAHHASLAGDHRRAARACVEAGRRCLALFANAEALALARRGARAAAELTGVERTRLQIELAQVSLAARPPAAENEIGVRLEELARRALDEGSLEHARLGFHLLAYLRWDTGRWDDAERHMREAEQIGRATEPADRAVAMAEAARCLVMLERDLPQAEALLLEASALAERAGLEAAVLADTAGMLRHHGGDAERAARLFDEARALARRSGDRMSEFRILEHRLPLELEEGRLEAAHGLAEELVRIAARLREGSELPFARALEALTRPTGDLDAARSDLETALSELERADAKHRLAYVLTRVAALDLRRGDAEGAAARARRALDAALAMERPSEIAMARVVLARAARALGDAQAEATELAELERLPETRLASHVRARVAELRAAAGGGRD